MDRRFGLVILILPLLGTTCLLDTMFFVANESPRSIHVQYAVPCSPTCPAPTSVSVRTLRHGGQLSDVRGDRLAPAEVRGRVDSLVTYDLDLQPGMAVRLFDALADFGGNVHPSSPLMQRVRVTVDTGVLARSFQGRGVDSAFQKWHKLVHVLAVQ